VRLDPGPIPLYHQLERALRARIHADEFEPGAPLPTEERLCEAYGVSRITVRRALDALISQGLIIRRRGVGSFVAERRDGVRSVRLVGSLDEFLATAGSLDTRFLTMETVDPPALAAEALRLAPNEEAVRLELAAYLGGHAVGYFELFFPVAIGRAVTREGVESGTPTIRMIERELNLRIVRAEQLIEADVAGEAAARQLGLSPTDPVLRVTRIYYAADGRPVEAVFVRYHSDRYRYAIEFQAGRSHG
jgi:GntR family transcriptional regulator